MPKFLFQASYNAEGARGVLKGGGSARRAAVEQLMKELGGKVEAFYFVFGDVDACVIVDVPGNMEAVATALAANVPLTPEEVDAATKRTAAFRAPGG